MSTGVGGTISATKNKPWEVTINGKTRRVISFLNCTKNPVCAGAIFSREPNNNTQDSTVTSVGSLLDLVPSPCHCPHIAG